MARTFSFKMLISAPVHITCNVSCILELESLNKKYTVKNKSR
jgi:hypothetical protein